MVVDSSFQVNVIVCCWTPAPSLGYIQIPKRNKTKIVIYSGSLEILAIFFQTYVELNVFKYSKPIEIQLFKKL